MNQHEEAAYVHTLLAFKQALQQYGVEQVQYDLQRFAEEFEVEIAKRPLVDRFRQKTLDLK